MPHALAVLVTFFFVNITWVYFRAISIEKANYIIKSMFGMNGFDSIVINKLRLSFENGSIKLSLLALIGTIILLFIPNSVEFSKKFKPNALFFTVTLVLMFVSILSINKVSEFLYFQF